MNTYTVKSKLLCQELDSLNYTTYVFELIDLDEIRNYGIKYIMCTRWPNWDHRELKNGEQGYLNCSEIVAGVDKWYADGKFTAYNYSNIQFNKFIPIQITNSQSFIL